MTVDVYIHLALRIGKGNRPHIGKIRVERHLGVHAPGKGGDNLVHHDFDSRQKIPGNGLVCGPIETLGVELNVKAGNPNPVLHQPMPLIGLFYPGISIVHGIGVIFVEYPRGGFRNVYNVGALDDVIYDTDDGKNPCNYGDR